MTFGERPKRAAIEQVFFWQAANTGVRSIVPKHAKGDCAAQEFLTGKTDRRKECRVVRDTTTWLGIFL